jgi:hypothetical protein
MGNSGTKNPKLSTTESVLKSNFNKLDKKELDIKVKQFLDDLGIQVTPIILIFLFFAFFPFREKKGNKSKL